MAYKPLTGKLKVNIDANTFNVSQFRPQYEDKEKALYETDHISTGFFGTGTEFKEKTTPLSFDILRQVATQVAPIAAIIDTRKEQIASYAKQSRYSQDGKGFKITLRDKDRAPKDEELEEILEYEEFILNCGRGRNKHRDDLGTFLRKGVQDTLTLDQMPFEIIREDDGKPYEFMLVDGATIRAARDEFQPDKAILDHRKFLTGEEDKDVWHILKDLNENLQEEEPEETAFVQVVDGNIVAWFTEDELAFPVRNPSTDINTKPYGRSEIELIVRQLTSYMQAEDYNMRFFEQGGLTKGILNIKEDPNGLASRGGLESFKRQWRSQVTGAKGAWKIPVLQLPGEVEFINIQQSNGEMVFEKWQNYLINIICAIYKIDPAEINFPNNGGVGGKGNSLFDGGNSKVEQSKDKGLTPLLQFFEDTINRYILQDLNDKYVFTFVGLDEESEQEALDKINKKVSTYMTVNEIRAQNELEPIENGDIILNPYFMQAAASGGAGGGFDIEGLDEQESDEGMVDDGATDEYISDDIEKAIMSIEVFGSDRKAPRNENKEVRE
ncbi:MAG: phage portal protein [Tissierellia bacterium]|nr:phage portal protein [Tissierellia bacterium]